MAFVIRQFHQELTLGEKLHSLRKEAKLTLTELAEKTKIQKAYLKAFEENAFHKLPDPVYARNYLKTLARVLGGEEAYYIDQFELARGTCAVVDKHQTPRQRTRATSLFVTSRFAQITLFVLLMAVFTTYIGYELKTMMSPPSVSLYSPIEGEQTKSASILVKGKTEKGSSLVINGQTVLLSQDGTFEKEIALERGVNILHIESAKRYSQKANVYRRVIFETEKALGLSLRSIF